MGVWSLAGPCSSVLGHSGIDPRSWWLLTCDSHTCSFSIAWELVRTAVLITFLPPGLPSEALHLSSEEDTFEIRWSESLVLALGIPCDKPLCSNSCVGSRAGSPNLCPVLGCDGTVHVETWETSRWCQAFLAAPSGRKLISHSRDFHVPNPKTRVRVWLDLPESGKYLSGTFHSLNSQGVPA